MQYSTITTSDQSDRAATPAQNNRRLRRAAAARARRGLAGPVELTPNPIAQSQGAGGLFVASAYAVPDDFGGEL